MYAGNVIGIPERAHAETEVLPVAMSLLELSKHVNQLGITYSFVLLETHL